MFTVVLERNLLFYLMAAVGIIGIIGKIVSCMTIRRLTIAAENMAKSEHRLMKLIRAKYEHACMISDKVQNVDAFVDKYLFEYRAGGLKMHTWREIEKQVIWLGGVFALAGAIGNYGLTGWEGQAGYYAFVGVIEMAVLYLLYQWGDEGHAWNVIHTYIVDYLENVCAHRMAKIYHTPVQQTAAATATAVAAAEPEPESEPVRKAVFASERKEEPVTETVGGYYDLPRNEMPENRSHTSSVSEKRRETAREKVREAVLRTDKIDEPVEEPSVMELDEARKNMEKSEREAEERKVIIREILEQYLA